MAHYSFEELKKIGFKSIGDNVIISKKCSIYMPERISIGSNVRIDDFCILSGNITLHDNIHIAAHSIFYGGQEQSHIEFCNNTGCSSRVTIYAITDDFKNAKKIGVMQKDEERQIIQGKVTVMENAQIGASCVIFPNVTIGRNSAVYAMSLVKEDCIENGLYAGIPCKLIGVRA